MDTAGVAGERTLMKFSNIALWAAAAALAYLGWIGCDMLLAPGAQPAGGASPIADVRRSEVPVLVEFYADWCGPCRMIAPEVEKVAAEVAGRAKVVRINVDEDRAAAAAYGVRAVPTFIAFRSGQETGRQSGAIPASRMKALLGL
jgi:thioredoxin